MRQLKPRGVVQRIIAERIVSLSWKLRRVARAEEAVRDGERRGDWKHEGDVNLANDRYPLDAAAPTMRRRGRVRRGTGSIREPLTGV